MAKAPWTIASDVAVRDRVRRLSRDNCYYREAKRLVREENDTLGALTLLREHGYVEQAHVDAHKRWLAQEDDIESLV